MRLESITELSGQIELITGLHIGAGDLEMRIGGVDNAVIRNPRSNQPYIPGSSLKGKIRSLLEWRSGAVQSGPLTMNDLNGREHTPLGAEVLAILRLFGVSGDATRDDVEAKLIGPTRVSFRDATLIADSPRSNLPVTEVKSENMIDRIRGVAKHPRQTERVVAGVTFRFAVTVKVLEGDGDLVRKLLEGMRLLEKDGLGGSVSRGYGKILFRSLTQDGTDIQSSFEAIDPFEVMRGAAA